MTTPVNVQRTASQNAKTDDATLKFGTAFTDHMFLEDYDASHGWVKRVASHDGVKPAHPFG